MTSQPAVSARISGDDGVVFDPDQGYWQQGGFSPVREEVESFELNVRGSIPSSLDGVYVRNGSNGMGETAHWFFGEGMIHGVRLDGGSATSYRNRYVRTATYEAAINGSDEFAMPGAENTQSNVSVVSHGGKLITLGEIGWPYQIDPTDLSTVGALDFDGKLGPSFTAHPKIDPATGLMHAFAYDLFEPPFLTYFVISPDCGEIVHSTPIDRPASTMIHDFAITDRDVVFWEGPVLFDIEMAMSGELIPYRWDPDYGARFGVMPLGGAGDQIRWVDVDPMFIFHGTGAHRDDDDIVVHASRLDDFFKRRDGLDGPSLLTEFRIGTGDQMTETETQLSDLPLDLPGFDQRYLTEAPSNAWYLTTQQSDDGNVWFEGITGYNFATGETDRWISGPDLQPNEAFFVPDTESAGRDEGWLLTYVWDRRFDRSELAIVDASNVAAGPVASIELPQRVPFGFHGTFHRG